MHRLFDYFLKLVTLPRHITFRGVFHTLLVVCGIAVIYLLTLRKSEEGKIEDYLQRIWNRVYHLREKALSYHLAFINGTAGAISSILDQLFGPRLVSLQSMGVTLSLALFFTNLYFLVTSIKTSEFSAEKLTDCLIALVFAGVPLLASKAFGPSCQEGGVDIPFKPLQCRYLTLPSMRRANVVQLGSIVLAKDYKFACLCSSTWIVLWFLGLLFYLYREYLSTLFCVSCFPVQFRPFLLIIICLLFVIFAVAATLFTLFSIATRLSLRKLSTTTSTAKAIAFLLLGCLPIPVFIVLLELVLVLVNRWVTGSQSVKEWIAVGLLFVFIMVFFINAIFLVAPVLFFSMAMLLLIHRLMWPMLERPLDKLNRIGLTKHPWVIFLVGISLIALGVGGLDGLMRVLRFFGYGAS